MVFFLVAGKNIFLTKSPNSTVKKKTKNKTPLQHLPSQYTLYLDKGYTETCLINRAPFNCTIRLLEQV